MTDTAKLSVPAESIKMVGLTEVKPNPKNPRVMSDSARESLEESLLAFGLVDPLIVNEDMVIIGGHQRYAVLLDLVSDGRVEVNKVPVVVFEGDERKQVLLNIALNKISGRFDYEQLATWVAEEAEDESDLDNLTLSGFSTDELGALAQASDEWLEGLGDVNGKTGNITQMAAFATEKDKEATITARIAGEWVARYADLPIDMLDPNDWNPNVMPDARFNALKTSIDTLGLGLPIMVRPLKGRYQIIDGEKRWRACVELGKTTIACQIAEIEDDTYAMALSLATNKLAGHFDVNTLVPTLNELIDRVGEDDLRKLTGWSDLKEYTGLEKVPEAEGFEPPEGLGGDEPDEMEPMVTLMLNLPWDDNEFVVNVLRQLSDDLGEALLICCKACVKCQEDGTTDKVIEEMGCEEEVAPDAPEIASDGGWGEDE